MSVHPSHKSEQWVVSSKQSDRNCLLLTAYRLLFSEES